MNCKITFILTLFVLGSFVAEGQNSDGPKSLSNTYYLKNCFVVTQPGVINAGQNLLIKNGFILDVGPNVKPTFDAQIVKSDSMYVYAGFIDAYSHTGIANPDAKDRKRADVPSDPPNDLAGITPQHTAAEAYLPKDKSVGDLRSAGFGIANVLPRGGMLPGYSSLMLLGEESTDAMTMKEMQCQNLRLEPARGMYPSTTIGVMAKFRDIYKNANIAGVHADKYKLNPAGLARPDLSKEYTAMYPVTIKKMKLYFPGNTSNDISKALSLKNELGFDLVLTEVKQGWRYLDQIKAMNIPILLSLQLPELKKKNTEKDEAKKDKDKKDKKSGDEPKKDTETKRDTTAVKVEKPKDPEQLAFDAKKEASQKEHLAQAAVFEKNNIAFGWSLLEVKSSDIHKNLRAVVEAGLSENAALAALTTVPAKMLGIESLAGTVEKGKIANLVLTDKPYFDEKALIKHVFVDGKKFDYDDKPKSDEKPSEAGKYIGTWSYTVDAPSQKQTGKMIIKKVEGEYTVKVIDDSSPAEEDSAADVSFTDDNLSFTMMQDMGQPVKLEFNLIFTDTSYSGSVSVGQFDTFPMNGELTGEPEY